MGCGGRQRECVWIGMREILRGASLWFSWEDEMVFFWVLELNK